MENLPDGPLGWIMGMLPILECVLGLSLVCRHWDRVLREVCRLIIHEIPLVLTLGQGVVTDAALLAVTTRFQCLTSINLTNCARVTDVGVQVIGAGCPSLRSINLAGCAQVTDLGGRAIGIVKVIPRHQTLQDQPNLPSRTSLSTTHKHIPVTQYRHTVL